MAGTTVRDLPLRVTSRSLQMRWQLPTRNVIAGQLVRPERDDFPVGQVIAQRQLVDTDAPFRDPVAQQLGSHDHLVHGERADGQRGSCLLHRPHQR
jgi:hypothetical protein